MVRAANGEEGVNARGVRMVDGRADVADARAGVEEGEAEDEVEDRGVDEEFAEE